jgi:hypothetical protein
VFGPHSEPRVSSITSPVGASGGSPSDIGTARRCCSTAFSAGCRPHRRGTFVSSHTAGNTSGPIYLGHGAVGLLIVGHRKFCTASLTDEKISNSSLNCSAARAARTGPAFPTTKQKARSDSPATAAAAARACCHRHLYV